MKEFDEFYWKYLGLNEDLSESDRIVTRCPYRDSAINKKYFYRVIAARVANTEVVSVSDFYSEEQIRDISKKISFSKLDNLEKQDGLDEYGNEVFYLLRMVLEDKPPKHAIEEKNSEDKYEYVFLEEYRKYVVLDEGELVGYCKISDVILGYGNIVVWVDENYRRLGLGKQLISRILEYCEKMQIPPMYIVRSDNYPSIALAKSMGFTEQKKELVIAGDEGNEIFNAKRK